MAGPLSFVWYADLDNDGDVTDETARYTTARWIPSVIEPLHGGRQQRAVVVPTLNGESMVLQQGRAGRADGRGPGQLTLTWEEVDLAFLRLAEEDYARGRLVGIRLDHRWRQLRVTSSGAADRKVTVAAGYLLYDGDTYWLQAAAEHTCTAGHTKVYATPAAGAVSIGSDTSVPAGSVQLAAISITDNVVTVTSDPSGAANARQGYIIEFTTQQRRVGNTGLVLTIQETR